MTHPRTRGRRAIESLTGGDRREREPRKIVVATEGTRVWLRACKRSHRPPSGRTLTLAMRRPALIALAALLVTLVGCPNERSPRQLDTALVDLALHQVAPAVALPGTVLVVTGDSFVDDPWGTSRLRLTGDMITQVGTRHPVDVRVPARFRDFQRLEASIDLAILDALGGDGARFEGTARVEVDSAVDGTLYHSAPIELKLELHDRLEPRLSMLQPDGIVFPNDPIAIGAEGLLLTGEGETVAELQGCFIFEGGNGECVPLPPVEVPVRPAGPFERESGAFPFMPRIAGLLPGRFEGDVRLRNRHADGTVLDSAPVPGSWDQVPPILYGASTDRASLGQYVVLSGAGFVGAGEGDTLLHFAGTFTPDSTGTAVPVEVLLLPEFVDGHTARYVVNEDDAIGQLIDVRFEPGVFAGSFTPEIAWGAQSVFGSPAALDFRLEPVRQIVVLDFRPGYVESLRHFGLRAVDQMIRERVVEVITRDYATIGLEVRTEVPEDFALYTHVELSGPDPNGLGLLGYDNTQGKDTENQRLYDRIGGVNALTQEDGFPGYGGVFLESLFGYSEDPGSFADPLSPEPHFDALFDPFRPDRGGMPVSSADLADDLPTLTSGASCPVEGERRLEIACAVWAMGSLVGSTVSHEIGHALGLADPYGPFFHNSGDQPHRLMDADRPFIERAEIAGESPSRFCDDEYLYLRAILPTSDPPDPTPRPSCF
jgi:hypothetical protein